MEDDELFVAALIQVQIDAVLFYAKKAPAPKMSDQERSDYFDDLIAEFTR